MTSGKDHVFTVNGEQRSLSGNLYVSNVLEEMGIKLERKGVAVAVNGELVTRTEWASVLIASGDEIEIVRAIQGG